MRVLMTTRGSSGHVTPLAPFGRAFICAGHEVLVAAQRQNAHNVERTGLRFAPLDDPPLEEWMPLMAQFGALGIEEANARMIAEFFASIDTRAALPGLRAIVEEWQPDVIVRESWEFASTLVAELYDIPIVRVGLGLAQVEELSVHLATPAINAFRSQLGLPIDPHGDRMRASAYFTMVPAALEDPAARTQLRTRRFAADPPAPAAPLPAGWWPGNDDPLVYVTFGSVTAAEHLPYFPALYRSAIEQLAPLRARILVTIGEDRDLEALGELPANVHVERWVAQDDIAPHAAAIVCHGGYGTTLGALRQGVPLVVLPLFSTDQWSNAAAVSHAGAGVALDAEHGERRVLELPGNDTLSALRPAVERVLTDGSYRREAGRIAAASRSLPPIEGAAYELEAISLRHGTKARRGCSLDVNS